MTSSVLRAASNGAARDTRESLLLAAAERFATAGFAGTRLADVTADARVTIGAFYRHFSGKGDLLTLLFQRLSDDMSAALSASDRLEVACQNFIVVYRRHPGVVRAMAELTRAGTEFAELRRSQREEWVRVVERLVPGEAVTPKQQHVIAKLIIDMLDYYCYGELAKWRKRRSPQLVGDTIGHLVRHGLYQR